MTAADTEDPATKPTDSTDADPAKEEGPFVGEATLEDVIKELERLLSKENLATDQTIASALNPQLCVSVSLMMMMPSIQKLTTSLDVMLEAAEKSPLIGVSEDKTMIRPLLKSKRNTLILRDLDATEEEVKDILKGSPGAEEIQKVWKEVNDTWFVQFESEEKTQDTALWLRSQKFKDQPIKSAIKSEHFLRSFFPAEQATAPSRSDVKGKGMPFPMPPYGFFPGKGLPGKGMPMMPGFPWMFPPMGKGLPPSMLPMAPVASAAQARAVAAKAAAMASAAAARSPTGAAAGMDASLSLLELLGAGQFAKNKGEIGKAPEGKKEKKKKVKQAPQVPLVEAMPVQAVPPSPPKPAKETVLAQMSEVLEEVPQVPDMDGAVYDREFRKYTRSEILAICQALPTVAKPDTFAMMKAMEIALPKPNTRFAEPDDPAETPEKTSKDGPRKKEAEAKKKVQPKAKAREYTEEEWAAWNESLKAEKAEKAPKKPDASAKKGKKEEEYSGAEWAAWAEPAKTPRGANKKKEAAAPAAPAMKWVAKKA